MLQMSLSEDIALVYLGERDYKYLNALAILYLRLVLKPPRLFEVLERRIHDDFKNGGNVNQSGATSKRQMNRDLTYILNGRVPRKYGEMPSRLGNFERIAPSPQCEQYLKIIGGQKMFGSLMKMHELLPQPSNNMS